MNRLITTILMAMHGFFVIGSASTMLAIFAYALTTIVAEWYQQVPDFDYVLLVVLDVLSKFT